MARVRMQHASNGCLPPKSGKSGARRTCSQAVNIGTLSPQGNRVSLRVYVVARASQGALLARFKVNRPTRRIGSRTLGMPEGRDLRLGEVAGRDELEESVARYLSQLDRRSGVAVASDHADKYAAQGQQARDIAGANGWGSARPRDDHAPAERGEARCDGRHAMRWGGHQRDQFTDVRFGVASACATARLLPNRK